MQMDAVDEVARLRVQIAQTGAEIRQELAQMGASLRVATAQMEASIRVELAQMGSSIRQELCANQLQLLKWGFLFSIGQVLVITSIIGLMLRAIR
jgi:hypothetical protein